MSKLVYAALNEAIAELAASVRNGHSLDSSISEIADAYEIKPAVLCERFITAYPEAVVPQQLPSNAENEDARVRAEANRLLKDYGRWIKPDGREVMLDGVVHTLITEFHSRRQVLAFRHSDRQEVRIPFDQFERMEKSPAKVTPAYLNK